jgi:hypothetical protein
MVGATGGMVGATGGMVGATGGAPGSGGVQASGAATGSGGAATTDACGLDFATLPANAPASLKDDLLPIFGLSCGGDSCHSAPTKKAGLYLGPKCDFDATVKWSCKFPAAPNPDTGSAPVTQQVLDEVWASLMENAKTVTGPAPVKRVTPGSPQTSFIIDKTADKQNQRSYVCVNTDPKPGAAGTCGEVMPLNGDPLCRSGKTGGTKYTAIAQWIKNGAQKN